MSLFPMFYKIAKAVWGRIPFKEIAELVIEKLQNSSEKNSSNMVCIPGENGIMIVFTGQNTILFYKGIIIIS